MAVVVIPTILGGSARATWWEDLPGLQPVRHDHSPCRGELSGRGLAWSISVRGTPVQVGERRVVEAASSAMSDFGRIRRCTERSAIAVQAHLDLAAAIVTVRALLRRARTCCRWQDRPRSPRIR